MIDSASQASELLLADKFQPDPDMLVAEGLIAFGVKGSGKSNLLARIVEQFGRFHLPQVIFDTECEYQSLIDFLPRGVLATAQRCPSGSDILHKGLQVVVDLRSWDSDEAAAQGICQLLDELFSAAAATAPQYRVPCIIHLDEAAHWLPQASVNYLSKSARQSLADAFHHLASRGRKFGLSPFLYTQSISEILKSSIRQAGVKVLMRQTLDLDIKRYCEYISGATARTRKAIQAFPPGKAIVITPDGSQRVVRFYERESVHLSHTPRIQAALAKFAGSKISPRSLVMRDLTASEERQPSDEPIQITEHAGRGRPKIKEKRVTFRFTADMIAFLDSLPEGTTKTQFIEGLIESNQEYQAWMAAR